ncbi:MAG: hypothetical protein MHM6MM_009076 [Cercozoa sp. M6MM]
MMKSPNGQVQDVVTDLRKLIDNRSVLSDAHVDNVMRNYNEQQLFLAGDDSKVIIAEEARVGADEYVDPETGAVLKFDHVAQRVQSESTRRTSPGKHEALRSGVQRAVQDYASQMFTSGKYAVSVYDSPLQADELVVLVSAKNLNLRNYWCGGWRSRYTLSVARNGRTQVKGIIRLQVHYFEDGNVQLNSQFERQEDVDVDSSDVDGTGKAVAAVIERIESEFQESLEEFYVNMHDNTFKALRRILPVTRQHMDWRSAVHGIAADCASSAN